MRTEDYIADNIIALCKKRDMSKYRMAQFFAGMDVPVSLSESQQEVLNIWNNLDEKEQNVVIQMLRGLQK